MAHPLITAWRIRLKRALNPVLANRIRYTLIKLENTIGLTQARLKRSSATQIVTAIACEYRWSKERENSSNNSPRTYRDKPHILFVTEKWVDCDPKFGGTNHVHNLFGSLEVSGLATQTLLYYDEFALEHGRRCDSKLLGMCANPKTKPDVIVLSYVPGAKFAPALSTFRMLQAKLGIPIVAIWGDTAWPRNMYLADAISNYAALNIAWDSSVAYRRLASQPDKWLATWTPQDERVFRDSSLPRDIDVCFVGSTDNRLDRKHGIAALLGQGIEVTAAGGLRQQRIPVEDYARLLQRSKLALNFALSGKWSQVKGRVFEATLCGAMLLESENPETRRWFTPMVEYVPFHDTADLTDKARYYLEHEAERLRIAAAGHLRASTNYTGTRFWGMVLAKVGLISEAEPCEMGTLRRGLT